MALIPRSRTARRRLLLVATAGPILVLAAGLTLYGLRGRISYFYTPAQALQAHVGPGQPIQLGGLVETGSVIKRGDGAVEFLVTDRQASSRVIYHGDLPDLFREGQGVVALGAYDGAGDFIPQKDGILAKHDERYMPRELTRALKSKGEWRGGGAPAAYARKGAAP